MTTHSYKAIYFETRLVKVTSVYLDVPDEDIEEDCELALENWASESAWEYDALTNEELVNVTDSWLDHIEVIGE